MPSCNFFSFMPSRVNLSHTRLAGIMSGILPLAPRVSFELLGTPSELPAEEFLAGYRLFSFNFGCDTLTRASTRTVNP